jgi:hypothetical protein
MKQRKIALHIDELALRGFAPRDHRRIGESVERELTRLLVAGGLPQTTVSQTAEIRSVPPASFQAEPHASAASIGVAVARAVYGRLSK